MSATRNDPPSGSSPAVMDWVLRTWVFIQVGLAAVVLVLVLASYPLEPTIALRWPGLHPEAANVAGLAFWLIFGLAGGLRARMRPGGAVHTFSMPFVVAGTMLGGPVAGVLMGAISEFELREVRITPWYGMLVNHAVSIIAATGAWFVAAPALHVLSAALVGQPAIAFFVASLVAAGVFVGINVLLVIPTLALRNGLSIAEARRVPDARFRATSLAEAILAWNLAASYLLVGWWASVAVTVLVLMVWEAHDRGEALRRDAMTGLLNRAGFTPILHAAVENARLGRQSAALLFIDLDGFKYVNDTYLERAGDEVLVITARRVLAGVRALDGVSRLNGAGDEFVVLLHDVPRIDTARSVAERIQAAIREPIRLRSSRATVHVDASIGVVHLEQGIDLAPQDVLDLADARMQIAKRFGSQIVVDGQDDLAELERRRNAGPRRAPVIEPQLAGPQ
jgi:diguanylate cyclase (GGDEF)-like protein